MHYWCTPARVPHHLSAGWQRLRMGVWLVPMDTRHVPASVHTSAVQASDTCDPVVLAACHSLLHARGKRLRPLMIPKSYSATAWTWGGEKNVGGISCVVRRSLLEGCHRPSMPPLRCACWLACNHQASSSNSSSSGSSSSSNTTT